MRLYFIISCILVLITGAARAQGPAVTDCPDNFVAFAEATRPLQCICSAEATKRSGSVWGMDVYTSDSSICRAAVHAGVIAAQGGQVTLFPEAGRNTYAGLTRNGVSSSNYGAYKNSFRFMGTPQAPAESAVAPAQSPAQASATHCPDNFVAFAEATEPLPCTCSAEATKRSGSVWGMDVYTSDSSICRAAVHAGVIAARGDGQVTVIPEAGRSTYAGLTRNGVSSSNYGAFKSSFRFAGTPQAPAESAVAPAQSAARASVTDCPDNFVAFAEATEPLPCTCSAEATKRSGSVWGMDVYTSDSSICRAAVHAGVIAARGGGQVTVIPEPGRRTYAGLTRNGVSSSNYGAFKSSFRFAGAPQAPAAPAIAQAQSSAPAAVTVCPDNFDAFAEATDPLPCICSADATNRSGSVWGMDVYTSDSSICRAALHAGVIAVRGGQVMVIPEAGRNAYAGLTRNGVSSSNYGPFKSSFRFAPVTRPAAATDKPVQAPIAATIQARGEVALYIQFRFDSSDLDVDAAPTLMELRDALNGAPNLRLMLVGHTDAVGTPGYNKSLSFRRAQSVMSWLIAQGIASPRLAVDGKGQEQPIADNSTDAGRAVNRRVQAVRIQ